MSNINSPSDKETEKFFQYLNKQKDEQEAQKAVSVSKEVQKKQISQQTQHAQFLTQDEIAKSDDITSAHLTQTGQVDLPQKPQLPAPFIEYQLIDQALGHEQEVSLISILAAVLVMQATMSSNFWETLFNEASQQMEASIKLAPVIASAVQKGWDEQAAISENEAHSALAEGIVNIAAFAASSLMGAMAPGEAGATSAADEAAETTVTETEEGMELTDMSQGVKEADATVQDGTGAATSKVSKAVSATKTAWKNANLVMKAIVRGQGYAQMFGMLAQGINGITTYIYKVKIARDQKLVGQWQALEKTLEGYSQYYSQGFSRTDNLTQGSEKNIQSAMDILNQIASGITQAVSSGFRG